MHFIQYMQEAHLINFSNNQLKNQNPLVIVLKGKWVKHHH